MKKLHVRKVFSFKVRLQDISLRNTFSHLHQAKLVPGCTVTSTITDKIRQVGLLKQETIGIIFNWDISTMQKGGSTIAKTIHNDQNDPH